MLYETYEARRALTAPLYGMTALGSMALQQLPGPLATAMGVRQGRAMGDTISALRLTHERPEFGIESALVGDRRVAVREERVTSTPFGTLLRFAKEIDVDQPRVLLLPGLAGHFATLLRDTVRTFLPDHEVYVADWHTARDVPREAGPFGLDEYVEHIIDFLAAIGPGTHLVAVCQPCPAALAAAAIMAEDDHSAQPRSLLLMAGPVDARVNPGPVNDLTARYSLATLERSVLMAVPWPHKGVGRRVYPGFLQVMGFMGMAPRRHIGAFRGMFDDLAGGRHDEAERVKAFYKEYFAVLDIAAEFYLDTARVVFIDHDLARGEMQWRGRRVNPAAIKSALLTIEAANDDMCPPGQTAAAHELCSGIPATRKLQHLQAGVGHYGVFSGTRFQEEIYPRMRSFIASRQRRRTATVGHASGGPED
jgi:poly(3-hydroxybutyrate) depolymerase